MNVRCINARPKPNVIIEQSGINERVQVFKKKETPPELRKKLRVAAYCRVSTDREEQESSLNIQMKSFRKTIEDHPDWELADIYADPGISGKSVKKRIEFLRMIEDAQAGKIDIIIAKSISRFARNTEDTLKYTRMLRKIGVGVIFEKENLDTRSTTSEMLLTIYAAFSQEESHDISAWERHGIRNDAARGKVRFTPVYGYTSKGKEKWIVVPEEAEVVKRVFRDYVRGKSTSEISNALNAEGIPTRKDTKWSNTSIGNILRNEKYIGDVLFQKSYVANFLTGEIAQNDDMTLPQYYISDNHEALVSKEEFEEAKVILALRASENGSIQYPYYGFLFCPHCGAPMVSFKLPMQTEPRCWICPGTKDGVKRKDRSDCEPFAFHNRVIDEAMSRAILSLNAMDGVEKKELTQIQKSVEANGKIERWYLNKLVEKITFPDYEHLTVFWKDGRKKTLKLKFTGYYTHSYPQVGEKFDGFIEYGGEMLPVKRLDKAMESMAKRVEIIQNVEITMPKEDATVQIPQVRKGK